jgi:hypothetical protein
MVSGQAVRPNSGSIPAHVGVPLQVEERPDQRTQTSSAIFTQVAFALLTLSCAASRRQENNEENPVYRANKERDNNQVIYPGSTIRPDGLGLLRAEGA